jgi:hypothetical protein
VATGEKTWRYPRENHGKSMGNMERSMKIPYKWCFNAENQGK